METKFTKGEWKDIIVSNADGLFYRVIEIGGESVCNITTRNTHRAQANAKLIAAAPEMLNALKELLKENQHLIDHVVDHGYIDWEDESIDGIKDMEIAKNIAFEAIKKATE